MSAFAFGTCGSSILTSHSHGGCGHTAAESDLHMAPRGGGGGGIVGVARCTPRPLPSLPRPDHCGLTLSLGGEVPRTHYHLHSSHPSNYLII